MVQWGSRKAASQGEDPESQQTWAGSLALLMCSITRHPTSLSLSFLNCRMGMTLIQPFQGCCENSVQCHGGYL